MYDNVWLNWYTKWRCIHKIKYTSYNNWCFFFGQVFQKTKRTYNLKDNLDEIISAMIECEGEATEGWRNPHGFWGKVTVRCGHSNTDYTRRAVYMIWRKNVCNVREKFQAFVASTYGANCEVKSYSSVILDVFKPFCISWYVISTSGVKIVCVLIRLSWRIYIENS